MREHPQPMDSPNIGGSSGQVTYSPRGCVKSSKSTLRLWRTPCLAGGVLLLALLACNTPPGVESTFPAPTALPSPTATQTATAEPSATATLPPTNTPEPTATPEPPDPLTILETYSSLANVRRRLDDMVMTDRANGKTVTGREVLEWILAEQHYDPTADNYLKEQAFAAFDGYDFPHPGARIMLVNVVTGLFAEANKLYPWSLADYSLQEIDSLFVEDSSLERRPDPTLHRGDLPQDMPNMRTHWYLTPNQVVEDAHYKQFNLARRLAQSAATQEEAAAALVVWMQQNFFHAYAPGYGWEVYLDGREPRDDGGPVAYPASVERIYKERVAGCHEPTILLEGMLHSLNVPAVRLMVHGHGVLYLPTLDRYVHGDHIVAYTDAPPGMLLLTADEFRPFAEDKAWIYAIVYPDKYQTPFKSMPLWRDGNSLYIQANNVRQEVGGPCIEVSDEDWDRISQQLAAYNLRYDTEKCALSSDRVPILTLGELNNMAP